MNNSKSRPFWLNMDSDIKVHYLTRHGLQIVPHEGYPIRFSVVRECTDEVVLDNIEHLWEAEDFVMRAGIRTPHTLIGEVAELKHY